MPTDEDLLKQIVQLLSGAGAISIDATGLATTTRQDTGNTALAAGNVSTASLDTKATARNASLTSLDAKIAAAAAAADAEAAATTMGAVRARIMTYSGTAWEMARSGITAVSATVVGFRNVLPWAGFHAAPVTRTEGQGGPPETDQKGNLRIAEQAPPAFENVADACAQTHAKPATSAAFNAIPYSTIAKATNGVIKAAPGNLYKIVFVNTNAAQKIVALVNKATAPTSDAPVCYYYVPALSQITIEFVFGLRFSAGIAWAQVTTVAAGTITLDTADMLVSGAECS